MQIMEIFLKFPSSSFLTLFGELWDPLLGNLYLLLPLNEIRCKPSQHSQQACYLAPTCSPPNTLNKDCRDTADNFSIVETPGPSYGKKEAVANQQ